ncbi:MAG TPA: CoA pyrophosphatase [Candidatus Limnocylindrales bacterium]
MRFADAAARLAMLPERLPPPPPELLPRLLPAAAGAPSPSRRWPAGPRRDAAVLVLIHPDERGEARVLLTERSAGGHRHAGQVSFPGGAIDPGDESVVAAALREAAEEVGLDPVQAGVRVVRSLAPIDVPVSGFLVHPVIALAERAPLTEPDGREVATVFSAPLAAFLPGAPIEVVTAERDGVRLRYGAYLVDGHQVWGATAGMLGGFGRALAGAASAEEDELQPGDHQHHRQRPP